MTLVDSNTDQLTIEAELRAPAILLVTDAFASGWQAVALPGSAQARYEVLPADYCLRAVPLAAGKHSLRLQYVPPGFEVGKWTSAVSLAVFLTLAVVACRRRGPR